MVGNVTCGEVESGWNAAFNEAREHQSHPRITGVIKFVTTTKFRAIIFPSRSTVQVMPPTLYSSSPPALSSLRWNCRMICAARFCTTVLSTRLTADPVSTSASISSESSKKKTRTNEASYWPPMPGSPVGSGVDTGWRTVGNVENVSRQTVSVFT